MKFITLVLVCIGVTLVGYLSIFAFVYFLFKLLAL